MHITPMQVASDGKNDIGLNESRRLDGLARTYIIKKLGFMISVLQSRYYGLRSGHHLNTSS